MNGPLNYYRTTRHRFIEEEGKYSFIRNTYRSDHTLAGRLAARPPPSLPVLFLWGDKDSTCSPSQVGRMQKLMPMLQVVRIPGKGHWLMVESAGLVVNSVAEFVRAVLEKPEISKL